jgi:hypothetical protein
MNKITVEDFWKVWSEPVADVLPVSYRLYYNDDGSVICYTMEDLPGTYIEVDLQEYLVASCNVRVVDKKLIHLPTAILVTKLQPNLSTGTACDPQDVCVVVNENIPHVKWSIK